MPPRLDTLGAVTLTQLGYAIAVDEHRHFGAAAAACHVTQPTLSMQLRKLEGSLGITLFDRDRSPVTPTEAGVRILAQARQVLRETARLIELRDMASGVIAGELRLGVIPTLAPYLLPRTLPLLARRHPGLELVVEERVTDDVIDRVRSGALDAGLLATSVVGGDLTERHLFTEPFVGYVSASHRLAARPSIRPFGSLSGRPLAPRRGPLLSHPDGQALPEAQHALGALGDRVHDRRPIREREPRDPQAHRRGWGGDDAPAATRRRRFARRRSA